MADDFASQFASTFAHVDQHISRSHRRFVMLDHDDGVALIPQVGDTANQLTMIRRVQTDRWFVQDIADADQSAADAGR